MRSIGLAMGIMVFGLCMARCGADTGPAFAGIFDASGAAEDLTMASQDILVSDGDAQGPACPDVSGRYQMVLTDGAGCGNLNKMVFECIATTATLCLDQIISSGLDGGTGGVNGGVHLMKDGTFSQADITLGTVKHTGCSGAWFEARATMEVYCGGNKGSGGPQQCTASMVRIGPGACP